MDRLEETVATKRIADATVKLDKWQDSVLKQELYQITVEQDEGNAAVNFPFPTVESTRDAVFAIYNELKADDKFEVILAQIVASSKIK